MVLGGGEETFWAGPGDRAAPSLGGVLGPPLGMVLHVSGGAGPPPGMMQHVREGSRPPPRDDAASSDVPPPVGATCACSGAEAQSSANTELCKT